MDGFLSILKFKKMSLEPGVIVKACSHMKVEGHPQDKMSSGPARVTTKINSALSFAFLTLSISALRDVTAQHEDPREMLPYHF